MELVPNPPINLQNNPSITSRTVIGFSWQNGVDDGGSPVIDYRITYDQGIDAFIILDSGLTQASYITKVYL